MHGGEVHLRAEPQAACVALVAQTARAEIPFDQLADLAEDPENGWSIGTFGALGEFMRDPSEAGQMVRTADRLTIVTGRGALRLERCALLGVAWESLSSDGRGWNHNLALCVPYEERASPGIVPLGRDGAAARPQDRAGWLFDLGVARGCVRMCLRTNDADLKRALDDAAGVPLLGRPDLLAAIVQAQPHRVMLSPAGRIEVFQPIPGPHDASPEGPHTHLLPRLIASGRLHGANDPVPSGWQAALSMHPAPPWSGPRGRRRLVAERVEAFAPLLARYGTLEDGGTAQSVIAAIIECRAPEAFVRFGSRRRRTKARIVLRQLAARCPSRTLSEWLRVHDRGKPCAIEASSCREVVVWRPGRAAEVSALSGSPECLRAIEAAARVFRVLDRCVDEEARPLVRMGLAALLQASRHVHGDQHAG
jgi:hypothetical protein